MLYFMALRIVKSDSSNGFLATKKPKHKSEGWSDGSIWKSFIYQKINNMAHDKEMMLTTMIGNDFDMGVNVGN